MKEDDFLWLQQWYQAHCNGNWEHDRRIHLGTLGNPGWSLELFRNPLAQLQIINPSN